MKEKESKLQKIPLLHHLKKNDIVTHRNERYSFAESYLPLSPGIKPRNEEIQDFPIPEYYGEGGEKWKEKPEKLPVKGNIVHDSKNDDIYFQKMPINSSEKKSPLKKATVKPITSNHMPAPFQFEKDNPRKINTPKKFF